MISQDRHRAWIDLVAEMFGGLDLCSLEALVGKDGSEVIIEVNDCAMGLLGESQEEDRRNIAEVTRTYNNRILQYILVTYHVYLLVNLCWVKVLVYCFTVSFSIGLPLFAS